MGKQWIVSVILFLTSFQCGPIRNDDNRIRASQQHPVPTVPAIMDTQEKSKVSEDKENLAKIFDDSDKDTAAFLRDPKSELTLLDTPFLRKGRILAVKKLLPTRALIRYIGLLDSNSATVLNSDEESFFHFVDSAGLVTESKELRVAYVLMYSKIVIAGSKRLLVLDSADDLRPRPSLSEAEREAFYQVVERIRGTIHPPKISSTSTNVIEYFAVYQQDLVKIFATLSPAGRIEIRKELLEENLQIPYSL